MLSIPQRTLLLRIPIHRTSSPRTGRGEARPPRPRASLGRTLPSISPAAKAWASKGTKGDRRKRSPPGPSRKSLPKGKTEGGTEVGDGGKKKKKKQKRKNRPVVVYHA
jgi:hypothetical protein